MPSTKASPPAEFIHKARTAFFTAISVPSWPMSMNEHRVVTSKKK
jgi:hypothetical protein